MPAELTMPQLSDTMTEGTLVKWLKKEGDKVKAGEEVAEIETDKATMPMESFDSGVLAYAALKEGQSVGVGALVGVIATGGEKAEEIKQKYASGSVAAKPPAQQAESAAQPPVAVATAAPAKSPERAAPPAPDSNGRPEAGRVKASPLARKIAADQGLDLAQIPGTGPGGRIVQADVLSAKSAPSGATPPRSGRIDAPAAGKTQSIPLTTMRATIAKRLQQSKQTIPHFYESIDIDVEAASALRATLNKQLEPEKIRLSIGDFVAKAVAVALLRHPGLNAHFTGTEIIRHGSVNLGMAVALPEGLIVPVLRGIEQLGLKDIRTRSADLVDRARVQRLKQDEMTGATFTVSNLGTYGVREFSAIINPPEVGILAVAAAEKRPVVRNDQIVARTMMTVTLSADHRAVDGAAAAEFLRTLKSLLEEPATMLL
ncbi:MAG TPA: dihydrolipoamide acetyltransferase family protein [Tepidisphaeraceae bacterium]|jgi:pyruvate dehydrogenase E2 component (dihydrolipoamide acetyltransferase)|nr:dihydrolipoamide acetyltransferase family protein [Tepidisphaeraceae bacterium]